MKVDLTSKVAIVFGAGRGIGEAIVTELAKTGAKVYIADLIEDNCKALSAKLQEAGLETVPCVVDVTKYASVEAVVDKAVAESGRVDIVINNAGIVSTDDFLDASTESFQRLINVNVIGVNNGTQAGMKRMIELGIEGKIVNTASIAGRKPLGVEFPHYGITKAAVIYLTQAAAYVGAPHNINVNSICPGFIRTPIWETIFETYERQGRNREEAWAEGVKRVIPLARGAQTEQDIAYTVVFLCSKYADQITGQAINIDGGAVMC